MNDKTNHCCREIADQLNHRCDQHSGPFDCADSLLIYVPKFDEYGIIVHDGGRSYQLIDFCPFCGTKLPDSKRNLWFERLQTLGFSNPLVQDQDKIPEEFKTDRWFRRDQEARA